MKENELGFAHGIEITLESLQIECLNLESLEVQGRKFLQRLVLMVSWIFDLLDWSWWFFFHPKGPFHRLPSAKGHGRVVGID